MQRENVVDGDSIYFGLASRRNESVSQRVDKGDLLEIFGLN